ncbi:hypothetical protein BC938DRAFT_478610, partial [Jimgerdemannia flammicorona]
RSSDAFFQYLILPLIPTPCLAAHSNTPSYCSFQRLILRRIPTPRLAALSNAPHRSFHSPAELFAGSQRVALQVQGPAPTMRPVGGWLCPSICAVIRSFWSLAHGTWVLRPPSIEGTHRFHAHCIHAHCIPYVLWPKNLRKPPNRPEQPISDRELASLKRSGESLTSPNSQKRSCYYHNNVDGKGNILNQGGCHLRGCRYDHRCMRCGNPEHGYDKCPYRIYYGFGYLVIGLGYGNYVDIQYDLVLVMVIAFSAMWSWSWLCLGYGFGLGFHHSAIEQYVSLLKHAVFISVTPEVGRQTPQEYSG